MNMQNHPRIKKTNSITISDAYFYRMLSAEALKYSEPYNDEEEEVLSRFFKKFPNSKKMNMVVVGSGELHYLRLGLQYTKDYTSIEPLHQVFLNESFQYLLKSFKRIFLINQQFNRVKKDDLPAGSSIFVFFFNVFSYLPRPIDEINRVIKEGDVVFISTWNTTKLARYIRRMYLDFLNSYEGKVVIDPDSDAHITHLDSFPIKEISFYKKHERIKGEITDILIIYT